MADNITQEDVIDLSGEMKSRRDKLSKLVAEGKNPYQITKYSPDTSALKIIEAFDEYENKEVCVAGRMVGKDTIKIITADSEASEAFFLGNSVKYLWRYKNKNGREDLQKAIKNIELLIENVYGTEEKKLNE